MNKYCVAVISFFDNEMKQEIIEAESDFEALKKSKLIGTFIKEELEHSPNSSIEDMKVAAFDMDTMFNIIQIP